MYANVTTFYAVYMTTTMKQMMCFDLIQKTNIYIYIIYNKLQPLPISKLIGDVIVLWFYCGGGVG